jgi:hypothetical protein
MSTLPRTLLFSSMFLLPCLQAMAEDATQERIKAHHQERYQQESLPIAVSAAQLWLHEVDADQYAKAWDRAAPLFQSQTSKAQWDVQMIRIRGLLGSVKLRKLASTSAKRQLPGLPDGEYLVLLFATSFEHKARGSETVTLVRDKGGLWQAASYVIR